MFGTMMSEDEDEESDGMGPNKYTKAQSTKLRGKKKTRATGHVMF